MTWLTRKIIQPALTLFNWKADRFGATTWKGLGTADIIVTPDGWSAGNLAMTGTVGATLVPSGGLTGQQPSSFYPAGFGGTNTNAIRFNGTTGRMTGGTTAGHYQGSFTVAVKFRTDTIAAGTRQIAGVYGNSTSQFQWTLLLNAGTPQFVVRGATQGSTNGAVTVVANSWNIVVLAYDASAQKVRMNVNGFAGADVSTNIPASLNAASSANFSIGSDDFSTPGQFWSGDIAEVQIFPFAASAAQIATAVADQMEQIALTNQVITVARANTEAVRSVVGGYYFLEPNAVLPIRSDGAQVWGATTNAVTSFTGIQGTLAADASIADPFNLAAASKLTEDGTVTATHYANSAYTATAVAWTGSILAKAGTRTWIKISIDGGTSGIYFNLGTGAIGGQDGTGNTAAINAAGNGWYRCSVTKTLSAGATTMRTYLATGDLGYIYSGNNASYAWLYNPQAELGTVMGPVIPNGGSPVARAATVVTAPNVFPNTTPRKFVATVVATHANWATGGTQVLLQNDGSGTNLLQFLMQSDGKLAVQTFDGGGGNKAFRTPAMGYAINSTHEIRFSYDPGAHAARIMSDGVEQVITPSGAGVALNGYATSCVVGSNGGTTPFNGNIASVRVYTGTSNPALCPP